MQIWRLFTCAALWVSAAGHAFVDEYGSATQPYPLGDATTDSWALCITLDPGQVAYYTFSADARGGTPEDKMWLGTYSPGCSQSNPACPERDFDFSVTVWGNGTFVDCESWAGWGDTVASTNYSVPAGIQVAGTVFGPGPATTFHAPARPFQRPVLEPYTPTAFTPRGTCVASYPRPTGTYGLAVWSGGHEFGTRHACVGLGLAEKSVFKPGNLIVSSFTTWSIHRWNRWSVWALVWPWFVLGFPLVWALSKGIPLVSSPMVPVSTLLLTLSAAIFAGQSVVGLITVVWAFGIAPNGTPGGLIVALLFRTAVPSLLSRLCFAGAILHPTVGLWRWIGVAAVSALISGVGFVVAPVMMGVALLHVHSERVLHSAASPGDAGA